MIAFIGLRGWRHVGIFLRGLEIDLEKRNTLIMVRGLPRERLNISWSIELEGLKRIMERH